MKKLTITLCTLVLVLLTVLSARAQVRDYAGRLDPKKGFERIRLAVEEFTPTGSAQVYPSDSMVLVRLGEIVRADLDFSSFHEVVAMDSFYLRHMELREMTLLAWSQLGADYVVRGEGRFTGSEAEVSYRVFVAKSGLEFAKGKFTALSSNWRRLGHKIANEIIYYLTGEEGIFDTRICFVSTRTGNKELYLCDYDGANVYQLTNNRSINISPAFDPDGKRILFTSFSKGDPQMFQYSMVDGSVQPIAAYPGINSAARVAPDGKELLGTLSRDGNAEIYLLDREGRIKRRLTNASGIETSPCWSPTGNEIAFTSDRTGVPQIYIMDKDGTNIRRLTYVGNYNESPDWSPRGDKIVFVSRVDGKFNICSADITGDNWRVLTELGNNENPHWSPDGNHIVFCSDRNGAKEVYIMDIFGNEEKRLTVGGGNADPAWSGYAP